MTTNSSCILTVISGDVFPETGYWCYDGHVLEMDCKAFVSPQDRHILNKKGEKAPTLGSCSHTIRWRFISGYKQKGDSVE